MFPNPRGVRSKENIAWAEKQNLPLSPAVKLRKIELQKFNPAEGSAPAIIMQTEPADQMTDQPILVTLSTGNSQQPEEVPAASALNRFRSVVGDAGLITSLFRNSVQSIERSQSIRDSAQSIEPSIQLTRELLQPKPHEVSQNWREPIENLKQSSPYDAPSRGRGAFASIQQSEPVPNHRFGYSVQDARNNATAGISGERNTPPAEPFQTTPFPPRDHQAPSRGPSQLPHQSAAPIHQPAAKAMRVLRHDWRDKHRWIDCHHAGSSRDEYR